MSASPACGLYRIDDHCASLAVESDRTESSGSATCCRCGSAFAACGAAEKARNAVNSPTEVSLESRRAKGCWVRRGFVCMVAPLEGWSPDPQPRRSLETRSTLARQSRGSRAALRATSPDVPPRGPNACRPRSPARPDAPAQPTASTSTPRGRSVRGTRCDRECAPCRPVGTRPVRARPGC